MLGFFNHSFLKVTKFHVGYVMPEDVMSLYSLSSKLNGLKPQASMQG